MKHKVLFCLQSDIWHLFTHNKKKKVLPDNLLYVSPDVLGVINKGQNCVFKLSVHHYEETSHDINYSQWNDTYTHTTAYVHGLLEANILVFCSTSW